MKRFVLLAAASLVLLAACEIGDDTDRINMIRDDGGGGNVRGTVPINYRVRPGDVKSQVTSTKTTIVRVNFSLQGFPNDDWNTTVLSAGGVSLVSCNLAWDDDPTNAHALNFNDGKAIASSAKWNMMQGNKATSWTLEVCAKAADSVAGTPDTARVNIYKKGVWQLSYDSAKIVRADHPNNTVYDWAKKFIDGARTTGVVAHTGGNTNYAMSGVEVSEVPSADVLLDKPDWIQSTVDVAGASGVKRYEANFSNLDLAWLGAQSGAGTYLDANVTQSHDVTKTAPDFSDSKVVLPTPFATTDTLPNGITITCMMKCPDLGGINGFDAVFGFYGPNNYNFFAFTEGGAFHTNWGPFADIVPPKLGVKDGQWHHVAVTVTSESTPLVSLYIDGVVDKGDVDGATGASLGVGARDVHMKIHDATTNTDVDATGASGTLTTNFCASTTKMAIGVGCSKNGGNDADPWKNVTWGASCVDPGVCVSAIRVYDRALTQAQVAQLYREGK